MKNIWQKGQMLRQRLPNDVKVSAKSCNKFLKSCNNLCNFHISEKVIQSLKTFYAKLLILYFYLKKLVDFLQIHDFVVQNRHRNFRSISKMFIEKIAK